MRKYAFAFVNSPVAGKTPLRNSVDIPLARVAARATSKDGHGDVGKVRGL
jgi:hypothetical protein